MAKRGRKTTYTPRRLASEVERYFKSITRTTVMTETKATGIKDEYGHMTFEQVPVLNDNGEEVQHVEWLYPPSVEDLAIFLGITPQTWANYCDKDLHPEFFDTTSRAQGRLRAWNARELLTRPGKDVRGIIFNLQNNFGYSEKREVELGEHATKAVTTANMSSEEKWQLLQSLMEQTDGEEEDTEEQ